MDHGVLSDDELRALMTLRAAGTLGWPFLKAADPNEFRVLGRRLTARGYARTEHANTDEEAFFITPRGVKASMTRPQWKEGEAA